MKNLTGMLAGIILGVGLLFTPMKSYSQEVSGQIGVKYEMDFSPIYTNSSNIESGALTNLGFESRVGFGYDLGFLCLEAGAQFGVSLNGDIGGREGYFEFVSKTPKILPELGAFARVSVFEKFFMEYSVNFLNQCSRIVGDTSFDNSFGTTDIDQGNIISQDILAGYANHKFLFGVHSNFWKDMFFDIYAGMCVPQIVCKTPLWSRFDMKTRPAFTIGGRVGVKINEN